MRSLLPMDREIGEESAVWKGKKLTTLHRVKNGVQRRFNTLEITDWRRSRISINKCVSINVINNSRYVTHDFWVLWNISSVQQWDVLWPGHEYTEFFLSPELTCCYSICCLIIDKNKKHPLIYDFINYFCWTAVIVQMV